MNQPTNPFALYQQCVQQWMTACENWQSGALAYQQAVASIMGLRTRSVGQWWQQAPQQLQAMSQRGPTPEGLEAFMNWYGQTFCQSVTLGLDTVAQRAHLMKTWRQLATPSGHAAHPGYAATSAPQASAAVSTPATTSQSTTRMPTQSTTKAHTFTQTVETPKPAVMPKMAAAIAASKLAREAYDAQQAAKQAAESRPAATVTVLQAVREAQEIVEDTPASASNVTPLVTARSEAYARPRAASSRGGAGRGTVPRPARSRTR